MEIHPCSKENDNGIEVNIEEGYVIFLDEGQETQIFNIILCSIVCGGKIDDLLNQIFAGLDGPFTDYSQVKNLRDSIHIMMKIIKIPETQPIPF